ncbi:DUF2645 family protein [Lelliottia sp. CFBP8978]|jgi:hypothetical protein|uniref:DUF2645 family protein n=1 Tax=Lelliottia sp. CFBP8978 TaxID=3096522 RepID=UPI002A6A49A2|nr:DUF2645 family protein [Lelliottia sp. CFBP8978]MDY1037656.1 DUF2645 family protein [Lelliottia sp. CFBP8978]
MTWKVFTLGFIWFCVSILWITFLSVQDKEWLIREGSVKNICDLMKYIETDDVRDVGIVLTIPLIFPAIYTLVCIRKHYWFISFVILLITAFWLWRFFLRYQICLW